MPSPIKAARPFYEAVNDQYQRLELDINNPLQYSDDNPPPVLQEMLLNGNYRMTPKSLSPDLASLPDEPHEKLWKEYWQLKGQNPERPAMLHYMAHHPIRHFECYESSDNYQRLTKMKAKREAEHLGAGNHLVRRRQRPANAIIDCYQLHQRPKHLDGAPSQVADNCPIFQVAMRPATNL